MSESKDEERFCKVCGKQIVENRHDGYCSDKCYIEDTEAMILAMASLGKALTERVK